MAVWEMSAGVAAPTTPSPFANPPSNKPYSTRILPALNAPHIPPKP